VRGLLKRQKAGKSFVRDFSPLRRVLVLVPAPGAGAMGGQKPPGGAGHPHPEKAEYKYPTQSCTNVQFC